MKILKILGILLLIVVLVVGGAMLFLPSDVHVERSVTIDASPSKVYGYLLNIKKFNEWSPWSDIDPNTNYTYEGPESGVGAKMSWESDNEEVGSGTQWIAKVEENKLVHNKIEFEGFEGTSDAKLEIEPVEAGTQVTWGFDTEMKGFGKIIGLFMDNMLGPQYEKGLGKLKENVESLPEYSVDITLEDVSGMNYLGIGRDLNMSMSDAEMSEIFGECYKKLGMAMGKNQIEPAGPPFAIYTKWDEETGEVSMIAAMPVAEGSDIQDDEIQKGEVKPCKAVKAVHVGAYSEMKPTYEDLDKYMKDNEMEAIGAPWEVYITDPAQETDTAKWVTHVYFPVEET
jgi:effector-binding domain-containing protein/uncharacterized protein YndB with AHSA1/START domain